jgi:hypothetical protein
MTLMRTVSLALVTCFALAQAALAGEPAAAKPDTPTPAQVRADLHRATADLIEAQSAEKPDVAKIQALTERVAKLRSQVVAPAGVPGAVWGGPGIGPGYGRGYGLGYCPGYGRGYGRGMGWGGGRGVGWGGGRGMGWAGGLGFVDANQNGICDRFEAATGQR